jgi:hypothetical protein
MFGALNHGMPNMIAGRAAFQDREIFTVTRHLDGWAVEHNGDFSDASTSKEEVRAAAHKHARAAHDAGRPCQVTVSDETGFFHPSQGGRR